MALKGNKMIPNVHFHKNWQRYIKTWYNVPAKRLRRKNRRVAKARKVAPRPLGKLRPIVRCNGIRYNMRQRIGKGFSLQELKYAGIPKKQAMTIGIAIDHKRKNLTRPALQANINRLKTYRKNLILFPRNKRKPHKADSSAADCEKAIQLRGAVMPIPKEAKAVITVRAITPAERRFDAYGYIRQVRSIKKTWGKRLKHAKEAAEDAAVNKK